MTRKPDEIRNVDASVRQRLFNLSKEQSRDFQSILKLYFLERFLYRLSVSRYRDSFLLKGAALLRPSRTGGAPVHQTDQGH